MPNLRMANSLGAIVRVYAGFIYSSRCNLDLLKYLRIKAFAIRHSKIRDLDHKIRLFHKYQEKPDDQSDLPKGTALWHLRPILAAFRNSLFSFLAESKDFLL